MSRVIKQSDLLKFGARFEQGRDQRLSPEPKRAESAPAAATPNEAVLAILEAAKSYENSVKILDTGQRALLAEVMKQTSVLLGYIERLQEKPKAENWVFNVSRDGSSNLISSITARRA